MDSSPSSLTYEMIMSRRGVPCPVPPSPVVPPQARHSFGLSAAQEMRAGAQGSKLHTRGSDGSHPQLSGN